ncbi:hypothetical protein EUTSA_v10023798mg [Eutrema salsugineum]|uniref:CCHC-type domain-containing protein n=1 Tax=Eutrema salsugineum TaxID=72664 RepID=V4KEZ3_EUTSA|nr:hypothetical protein EUTSA_v10023798mg [Eutrema salsugineum]
MSAFSSKVKISSKKGETLLLQTDLSRSNSVIPRSIQWKEINLPDEWVLEGVVQPKPTKPNEPLEPNTRLKHIEQFHDGKVKLSFIQNHHETIDDYTCESSSLPETIDLGRVSQLAQDFSRMENCPKLQPRFSTSDIPNSVLRNVDFRTQIPKPVYKAENSFQHNEFSPKSEPTSPSFSAVTDNMINELNVLEKIFQIDKEFLRDEFYSKNNTQKKTLKSFTNISINININFPFSKTANPITTRNKTPEWETLANGKIIRSNHPHQQGIKLELLGTPIEAIPFKHPQDNDKTNIKNIIVQNNFSNTNLGTIGKQLDRIEKSIQNQPITSIDSTSEKKTKKPIFKPFQISSSSVKTYQETNKEFIRALQSQLSKIDIGENSTPQESDISDTPTSKAQINNLVNESYSSETSEQNSTPEINRLGRENHQDHQIIFAPDLGQIQTIEQSRFNSSSVYDWNIDGISEYNILNFLQKMTMAANAYRTQVGNEDRTVAELLIAGFSGQLKGCHNLAFIGDPSVLRDKNAELLSNLKCKRLSDFQWYKNTFLTRVLLRQDSNQPFWKEKFLAGLPTLLGEKVRNKIRDSTGTQIIDYDDFTYGELISIVQQEGLKICQDLKLQKHLKWELKRTKVELGSFCRQFEIDPSKNSKFCIGDCSNSYYSKNKPRKYSKTYRNHKSHENSWQKPRKRFTPKEITNSKPFYKNLTCFKCNKKGHTSKFCRFNRKIQELGLGEELSSKISNLLLDHSSSSSNDSDSSLSSEKALQVDELKNSSSGSESDENKINVLTKDQEFQIEILNSISNPQTKQNFLETILFSLNEKEIKISENTSKPHNPTSSKSSYDLTTILNKRKKDSSKTTIQDLRMEIKEVKNDLKTLREKQKRDSEYFHSIISSIKGNHDSSSDEQDNDNLDNIEDDIILKEQIQSRDSAPKDLLCVLREITSRKYKIKITLVFSENYKIDTIALFDTGADLNCIKSGLVPKCFHLETREKLSAANNSKLCITSKAEASILKDNIFIKTAFVLTDELYQNVILGTPS